MPIDNAGLDRAVESQQPKLNGSDDESIDSTSVKATASKAQPFVKEEPVTNQGDAMDCDPQAADLIATFDWGNIAGVSSTVARACGYNNYSRMTKLRTPLLQSSA